MYIFILIPLYPSSYSILVNLDAKVSMVKSIALKHRKKTPTSDDSLMETDCSIPDCSQELVAKDLAKVQSPIQNANEVNLKTTGLTRFEFSEELSLDSDDVYAPPDFVCTPTNRTNVCRRRESGGEPHTPLNQRMTLVHEADPVLDIVKSDGSRG